MKSVNLKQVILSILCILILIVVIVGVSFAAFSYSKTGEKVNTIVTGSINMTYLEPTNGINLVDALPVSDDYGKSLTGTNNVFDFTVSADINGTGTTTIDYAITSVKGTSTVGDSAVKVYLTNIDTSSEVEVLAPTKVSELSVTKGTEKYKAPTGEFILASDSVTGTFSHKYRLRMWVADDYSANVDSGTYTLKVNVYGSAAAQ